MWILEGLNTNKLPLGSCGGGNSIKEGDLGMAVSVLTSSVNSPEHTPN